MERRCWLFKINFNRRIRYISHFPTNSGTELRIMLYPIDPRQFDLDGGFGREALRPPQDSRVGISAIQYAASIAEKPTLTIIFDRPVNFDAAGGADFQTLVFSVTDARHGKACKPVFPGQTVNGWEPIVTAPKPPGKAVVLERPTRPVSIPEVPVTPDVPMAAASATTGGRTPASAPASVSGPTEVAAIRAKSDTNSNAPDAAAGTLITEARNALVQGKFELAIGRL